MGALCVLECDCLCGYGVKVWYVYIRFCVAIVGM